MLRSWIVILADYTLTRLLFMASQQVIQCMPQLADLISADEKLTRLPNIYGVSTLTLEPRLSGPVVYPR